MHSDSQQRVTNQGLLKLLSKPPLHTYVLRASFFICVSLLEILDSSQWVELISICVALLILASILFRDILSPF